MGPTAYEMISTAEGNLLTREQQAARLRPVVEMAEEVWG